MDYKSAIYTNIVDRKWNAAQLLIETSFALPLNSNRSLMLLDFASCVGNTTSRKWYYRRGWNNSKEGRGWRHSSTARVHRLRIFFNHRRKRSEIWERMMQSQTLLFCLLDYTGDFLTHHCISWSPASNHLFYLETCKAAAFHMLPCSPELFPAPSKTDRFCQYVSLLCLLY